MDAYAVLRQEQHEVAGEVNETRGSGVASADDRSDCIVVTKKGHYVVAKLENGAVYQADNGTELE